MTEESHDVYVVVVRGDATTLPPKDGLSTAIQCVGATDIQFVRWDQERESWLDRFDRVMAESRIWRWEKRVPEAPSFLTISIVNGYAELNERKAKLPDSPYVMVRPAFHYTLPAKDGLFTCVYLSDIGPKYVSWTKASEDGAEGWFTETLEEISEESIKFWERRVPAGPHHVVVASLNSQLSQLIPPGN